MNRLDALKTRVRGITIWDSQTDADYVDRLQQDIERLVAVVEVMTTIRDMLSDPPTRTVDKIGRAYGFARDTLAYWLEEQG